ncbi:biotin carboxyl carrier protein of acetyl-CoA carboxylase, chloroplastic-like [Prosopis cineraria]|uniref:biotin carboxyl carrier protein of acetyl-CoA carboxylase, chloroplastic-like n=1 Tax=Prosopis cineraria TaxID=364024 RepID=UPI00240F9719|nr:biotin carboxyl carrier protein of acetyl-CoA carboxylase, chloroplastic-like [Prosopis cineraria]XP_054777896.1 biotin carboxyl carrier protein of acetyl-CoA carboxylase, chloroplastic-like [Prosopis cineraria]XP_054777904.1 biotin carboxyl carrier protein of acetyl-CoA carboxylase, chloroplastic-like [Prosopis cineraria]XP_054777913.1 biotin carboxyl carrier protein of acetyl-CoA carboxylase, chloroplastic-like [Prosopis cineraria]
MASFTVPCPKCVSPLHLGFGWQNPQRGKQILSFQNGLSLKPCQSDPALFGTRSLNKKQFSSLRFQAQPNEATAVKDPSNSAPILNTGSEVASSQEKDDGKLSDPSTSVDAASISAFMNQVSNLVKLVDSRDIVELQLKQSDYELLIRKKEALQPPPTTAVAPVPASLPYPTLPSPSPVPVAAPAPASPPPSKAAPASPSPGKASTSSHPPLKSPMAGTFYRSAAPGEPPFVKVGDKVQKGQVLCIIEAMKLMNEIEADQSGTIVEILLEDGKSVSVDSPLFVIAP